MCYSRSKLSQEEKNKRKSRNSRGSQILHGDDNQPREEFEEETEDGEMNEYWYSEDEETEGQEVEDENEERRVSIDPEIKKVISIVPFV